MDQKHIKHEVQALWLQYSGLKTGSAGRGARIENAARVPLAQTYVEELPEIPGLIIAT